MLNLFKHFKPVPEPAKKLSARAWVIDPLLRSIQEMKHPYMPALVEPVVGLDAECYRLDTTHDTVVWMSDTDKYARKAYYWEGMDYPFNVRRYSKALVVALPPSNWDAETIADYVRWYDKQIWGD